MQRSFAKRRQDEERAAVPPVIILRRRKGALSDESKASTDQDRIPDCNVYLAHTSALERLEGLFANPIDSRPRPTNAACALHSNS